MQIFLNGEIRQVENDCNITALIKELNLENKRLAVEVDQEIIPRSQFTTHLLAEGNKVEIIHAIGGG